MDHTGESKAQSEFAHYIWSKMRLGLLGKRKLCLQQKLDCFMSITRQHSKNAILEDKVISTLLHSSYIESIQIGSQANILP